jgi:hypothetical protein
MMVVGFWLVALALFAVATRVGRRFGLIPIVSQLLLASFGLPLLMYFWIEPGWQLSGAELIAPDWLKNLYSLSFALLLGHILSDVIDLKLDRQSVKIALPSFTVPFVCGLAAAYWLLPAQPWLNSLAIGLVFAITAIPVLYLYLRHIDYPPAATRRLVQTAILIDLTCWTLFGLAQGSLHLSSLLLPLGLACVPLLAASVACASAADLQPRVLCAAGDGRALQTQRVDLRHRLSAVHGCIESATGATAAGALDEPFADVAGDPADPHVRHCANRRAQRPCQPRRGAMGGTAAVADCQ